MEVQTPIRSSCRLGLVAAGILVFVPCMALGATASHVSSSTAGILEGNGDSYLPSISGDGRFVAFFSTASNLVPGDTGNMYDIFVRDRVTGKTTRVSVSSAGVQGNEDSYHPSISANGRFIAFDSDASNLVPGDTNRTKDVFVRDRVLRKTTRVSVSSAGKQGNGLSDMPSVSADGRYVAFTSDSTNLVPGDTNRVHDIFVRDRTTNKTVRVSLSSAEKQGNSVSDDASISADGRFVAFSSSASNLVPGDTNRAKDIFVRDRVLGTTTRVSVSSAGRQGTGLSEDPSISADGRFIGFQSIAGNLVAGDRNGTYDVFVRDRVSGKTTRVSVSSAGKEGDIGSWPPSISANGRLVTFMSMATNLVPSDTNIVDDVFVRDRTTGKTTRVSVSSAEEQANGFSDFPSISANGRFVAFGSLASNLVSGDTNGYQDVFVRDLITGKTTRASLG